MKKTILLIIAAFIVTNVYAQTPEGNEYNYQRRTLFEILPTATSDIIFLGNSITDGCEWSELFGNPNMKNRGISADRSYWILNRLDPIIQGKPSKLFLLIGVNDLGAGDSPQSIIENTAKIIERFQEESPQTKLYVQSIFPVNSDFPKFAKRHSSKSAEIVETNELLKDLCTQKNIPFIDVHSKLADQDGKLSTEYTNDGLHLMGQGYLVWKEVLEEYINE